MNSQVPPPPSVQARVAFRRAPSGATHVGAQTVGYPFHLGRTLSLPDDPPGMAALYLQSCSGGLFAGEDLGLHLHAEPGTCVHVSTGAATIAHSMREAPARQRVQLVAGPEAWLEYLPLPTILFPHARVHSQVQVSLHPGARLLLCDAFTLHTPAGTDGTFGHYRADLEVHDEHGRLLAGDRLWIDGEDFARQWPGVNGRYQALGTFVLLGTNLAVDEHLRSLRAALAGLAEVYAGASELPNECGVSVRVLALNAVALRTALYQCWAAMRLAFMGVMPRVRRK